MRLMGPEAPLRRAAHRLGRGSAASSSATVSAVLPDGTQVRIVLYVARP